MPPAPASDLFLAMDTSFEEGSVGVCRRTDQKTEAFRQWSVQHTGKKGPFPSHSEKLIPELLSALKEAGGSLSQVNFLAVSVGPGRWTGVRMAVNTARAFSFALKIPCYPLNSLRVTAEDFLNGAGSVVTAFNAFKNSVYFAEFSEKGKALSQPSVLPFPRFLERMKNKPLCVGDVPRFYDLPESLKKSCEFKSARPRAKALARITVREFNPKNFISWEELLPLYLREDVAKAKNKTGGL